MAFFAFWCIRVEGMKEKQNDFFALGNTETYITEGKKEEVMDFFAFWWIRIEEMKEKQRDFFFLFFNGLQGPHTRELQ